MNSHFLLDLYETNVRLGGAVASISSLSLNIAEGGSLRAASPELPRFLGSLGGPICSQFSDDDLETLDFAEPPQSEPESEPVPGRAFGSRRTGEHLT